jgi:hypothetical protein
MRVARSIDADHTTRVLDQIVGERGAGPELVRMDSGPTLKAAAGPTNGARHQAHCSTGQEGAAWPALEAVQPAARSAVDIGRPPCDCRRHCGDDRTSASSR